MVAVRPGGESTSPRTGVGLMRAQYENRLVGF